MILELLGLGMLGAIGKTVYDEAKKEQSSNNTNQSTTNKNYTDDSRYWNLIYSYARKYQYRKTEISYDILHEIQLKTNRDLSQIKCDYEKALNKINKKAEKAKTASIDCFMQVIFWYCDDKTELEDRIYVMSEILTLFAEKIKGGEEDE